MKRLFWTGARELSSSWLLTTFGSLFSSWFRLLFRFFHCHFLRSFFWLCSLLWGWSILGFDISIINLILRVVRIKFIINMTTIYSFAPLKKQNKISTLSFSSKPYLHWYSFRRSVVNLRRFLVILNVIFADLVIICWFSIVFLENAWLHCNSP